MIYGEQRRRVPTLWDVDDPVMSGVVQNQDAYMQAVAAQRPYFFEHIAGLAERCMAELRRAHRPALPARRRLPQPTTPTT
ncbi:MAG: hypothetical protein MZV65_17730 [Chromatiales bacterium]|nr:hypothetical protein [Chromatiales bacterium]